MINKIEVLNKLCVLMQSMGVKTELINGSLCINRPAKNGYVFSAAMTTSRQYKIRCIEKRVGNKLLAYSLKLNDDNDVTIRNYDYSIKKGFHEHSYTNGVKSSKHISSSGDLDKIAKDFIKCINKNIKTGGK